MSKRKVLSILGPGEEVARSELSDYITTINSWAGEGSTGACVTAMFQNGELVSMAQIGLD